MKIYDMCCSMKNDEHIVIFHVEGQATTRSDDS